MMCKYSCIILFLIVGVKAEIDYYSDYGMRGVPRDDESEESGEPVESIELVNPAEPVNAPTMIPHARYYTLSTCDYKFTPGYTCTGCTSALHCYATNMAIVVQCYGLFRYCRDGHCSMFKDDSCLYNAQVSPIPVIQQVHENNKNLTSLVAADSQKKRGHKAPSQTIDEHYPSDILSTTRNSLKELIPNENQVEALVLPLVDNRVDDNPIKDNNQINSQLEIYSGLKYGALGDYSEISTAQLKRVRRA